MKKLIKKITDNHEKIAGGITKILWGCFWILLFMFIGTHFGWWGIIGEIQSTSKTIIRNGLGFVFGSALIFETYYLRIKIINLEKK